MAESREIAHVISIVGLIFFVAALFGGFLAVVIPELNALLLCASASALAGFVLFLAARKQAASPEERQPSNPEQASGGEKASNREGAQANQPCLESSQPEQPHAAPPAVPLCYPEKNLLDPTIDPNAIDSIESIMKRFNPITPKLRSRLGKSQGEAIARAVLSKMHEGICAEPHACGYFPTIETNIEGLCYYKNGAFYGAPPQIYGPFDIDELATFILLEQGLAPTDQSLYARRCDGVLHKPVVPVFPIICPSCGCSSQGDPATCPDCGAALEDRPVLFSEADAQVFSQALKGYFREPKHTVDVSPHRIEITVPFTEYEWRSLDDEYLKCHDAEQHFVLESMTRAEANRFAAEHANDQASPFQLFPEYRAAFPSIKRESDAYWQYGTDTVILVRPLGINGIVKLAYDYRIVKWDL